MRLPRPLAVAVTVVAVASLTQVSRADGISSIYGGDEQGPAKAPVGGIERVFTPYVGSLHEHSGYSDGWVGSTPATYYASGKHFGLDFMGGSDHSDFLGVPLSTSQYCFPDPNHPTDRAPVAQAQDTVQCPGGDPSDETKSLTKWDATKKYAQAATVDGYSAFQGFEWSSDIYGHINVYFSKNFANGKIDGATTKPFYDWLTRRPELAGGSDGIATFNHPGAKDQLKPVRAATGLPASTSQNWNDFTYDARIDNQMVGLEVYNDTADYGSVRDADQYPEGYYTHVLDKGWHVAPVGAEDLGHDRGDDWGGPSWAKTVILGTNRSPAALKAAMMARRVYAVRNAAIRLDLHVDGELMGSRITAPTGAKLPVTASATWPGHTGLSLELVTSKGKVVATGTDDLQTKLRAAADQKYYYLRVRDGHGVVAYSAPVWVGAAPGAAVGEWLAGDLHVHTCYSHDAYCPRGQQGSYFGKGIGTPLDAQLAQVGQAAAPVLDQSGAGDSNTDVKDFYTLGGTVRERFTEAAIKGLDYLAITDHHADSSPQDDGSISVRDAGFGTSEVVGLPAYENSIHGHAQMLGATHVYPAGDQGSAAVNAMASALRADGGLLQANHPVDGLNHKLTTCSNVSGIQWGYGFDVQPDSVEVWNLGHYLQPPLPASLSNDDSEFYWECMLSRGWHVAATGGSDSHWMSSVAAQGLGNPTTWVFAKERSARGVLEAIHEGRTSISVQAPVTGGTQLLLEADANRDGFYEAMIGDTVPAGTPMRVRALGLPAGGLVDVRANGSDLLSLAPLAPAGVIDFTSPAKAGWVRAKLYAPDLRVEREQTCDAPVNTLLAVAGYQTSYCRDQLATIAVTSPIYLSAAVRAR